jgi:undecaprenyl pyrophosphate synthase
MSKKNIFLLAAWYVAGGLIASLYGKKKPWELQKDLEKSRKEGEGDFKVVLDNFIDTHANLIEKLKKEVLTDKNKELFNSKKDELLKVVDVYKKQWEELVDELKTKWKGFLVEASDNLEKLYDEKVEQIEQIKEETRSSDEVEVSKGKTK